MGTAKTALKIQGKDAPIVIEIMKKLRGAKAAAKEIEKAFKIM